MCNQACLVLLLQRLPHADILFVGHALGGCLLALPGFASFFDLLYRLVVLILCDNPIVQSVYKRLGIYSRIRDDVRNCDPQKVLCRFPGFLRFARLLVRVVLLFPLDVCVIRDQTGLVLLVHGRFLFLVLLWGHQTSPSSSSSVMSVCAKRSKVSPSFRARMSSTSSTLTNGSFSRIV